MRYQTGGSRPYNFVTRWRDSAKPIQHLRAAYCRGTKRPAGRLAPALRVFHRKLFCRSQPGADYLGTGKATTCIAWQFPRGRSHRIQASGQGQLRILLGALLLFGVSTAAALAFNGWHHNAGFDALLQSQVMDGRLRSTLRDIAGRGIRICRHFDIARQAISRHRRFAIIHRNGGPGAMPCAYRQSSAIRLGILHYAAESGLKWKCTTFYSSLLVTHREDEDRNNPEVSRCYPTYIPRRLVPIANHD